MFFLHPALMFKMTLYNFSALPLRLQVFVRRLPQRILQWKTQFAEFLFSPVFDVLQVPGQASKIERIKNEMWQTIQCRGMKKGEM